MILVSPYHACATEEAILNVCFWLAMSAAAIVEIHQHHETKGVRSDGSHVNNKAPRTTPNLS
jgi:hypothetical protein